MLFFPRFDQKNIWKKVGDSEKESSILWILDRWRRWWYVEIVRYYRRYINLSTSWAVGPRRLLEANHRGTTYEAQRYTRSISSYLISQNCQSIIVRKIALNFFLDLFICLFCPPMITEVRSDKSTKKRFLFLLFRTGWSYCRSCVCSSNRNS